MVPQHLHTERLILRRPERADAASIFNRYAGDLEVTRWLAWPTHRSVADSEAFVEFSDAQWHAHGVGPYLIESAADRQLLGSTGIALESADIANTGYVLARDAWGRGYATEALSAMVSLAIALRLRRFYALCHPEHRASQRVLMKCGFSRDPDATRPFEFPNLQPGVRIDTPCFVLSSLTSSPAP